MTDEHISLIDRLAGLAFKTKLFAVAVIYMLAMFALSEAINDDFVLQIWFVSGLPVAWGLALLAQWWSMRPRPTIGHAIADVVAKARQRPLISFFYALAAIAIEAQMVAWVMDRSLLPGL